MEQKPWSTEALEGHFSYYLQLICYSLIVITYLLMLTWFHIDKPNSDQVRNNRNLAYLYEIK